MKITVTTKKRSLPSTILIGPRNFSRVRTLLHIEKYSKVAVVTDSHVARYHLKPLLKHLPAHTTTIILPPGERYKNIKSVERIWKSLSKNAFDRHSLAINLGGGVVCDMGGFAASTYMRGIDFVNIPTTLLSQVDASVGGKVGIDYQGYKNLIGSFKQPCAVIIDVAALKTLPRREFIAGFAEIIKHGLIADGAYFDFVTSKKPTDFTETELVKIIASSCKIKSSIVARDEHEAGPRKLLNFGHTIGHAIEASRLHSKKPLLHGEAIAIGMIAETHISHLLGFLDSSQLAIVVNTIKKAGLPHQLEHIPVKSILNLMLLDKKNKAGKLKFTLLKKNGTAIYDQEVPPSVIKRSLKMLSL